MRPRDGAAPTIAVRDVHDRRTELRRRQARGTDAGRCDGDGRTHRSDSYRLVGVRARVGRDDLRGAPGGADACQASRFGLAVAAHLRRRALPARRRDARRAL
jgi:hypothetical protein